MCLTRVCALLCDGDGGALQFVKLTAAVLGNGRCRDLPDRSVSGIRDCRFTKNKNETERIMDELSSIFTELIDYIRDNYNIPPSSIKLWFGDLEFTELTDTTATFRASSPMKRGIVSKKYGEIIKESLLAIIGFEVDVVIYCENEQATGESTAAKASEESDEVRVARSREEERTITEIMNSPSLTGSVIENYTFDNFVEGSSNKFAKAACEAVAREPNTYNPLFIYGDSGLGKTHLLYAVINDMKKYHPGLKIIYKKCESFLDELIAAIKKGSTDKFKDAYRNTDVLLIDDIQFLAGKEQTQEEFFHTFSALYENDKQIILTSDRPPKEIEPLSDRLRTRFEGGLIADVQPPNFELRIAIIKKKADSMGLSISNEIIEYLAERLHNNIRTIEGVLKKLYAITSFTSQEVTKEKIDEVISIIDPGNIPVEALIERILMAVSKAYGVSVEDLKSKKKTDSIANARHVAIYVIKKLTDLTLVEIGKIMGRNHSTLLYSIERVETNIRTVNGYEAQIKQIIKEVKKEKR